MYFLSIIVLCYLFLQTLGRPTHVVQDYDKDAKEDSYSDSDSGDIDDYEQSEHKSSLKQFAGNGPATKVEFLNVKDPGNNEELDHARPDKEYLENNEEQLDGEHLSHDDGSMNNDVKRTAAYGNGVILHHRNGNNPNGETLEYNKDGRPRPNEHNRYFKQHIVEKDALYRDRRETNNNYLNEQGGTEISTLKTDLNVNEDEETAIRRHVKKLSKAELNELLQSLSEDKRTLLKNIIDNCQQEYENINKREITKKAGASEENSFVGNEQPDTSKVQGISANLEADSSIAPDFEKQDNTKKADTDSMYSKSTETANSSEKTDDKNNVLESIVDKAPLKSDNIESLQTSETESKIISSSASEKDTSKKESKREVNLKPFVHPGSIVEESGNSRTSNKGDLYCSDNEALSQLWNEESSLYKDNRYKRDTCSDDLRSSLEESFPIADNSDNLQPGHNMAPLVRVKRRNPDKLVGKRDTNVVSNIKVPYFSSVLENNEEGNDEGGEFQEDGFFDRGANIAKSSELSKRGTEISKSNVDNYIKYCGNSPSGQMDKNKLEPDTVGLGSDTDVVLSGIEGVDDNIMYNGVARIRRTGNAFDNLSMEGDTVMLKQENKQQLGSQNEDNEISEEYNNAARYQENDAFGSLPRNYEQELGRFKRIRRLKPENKGPAIK